jgi:glycosyltransferase involved in cell wall biosynthesis
MKILWCTWKDRKHPASGGAEVVNEEIAKRLVRDGHEVIFLVGGFKGKGEHGDEVCLPEETIDGYKVVRLGNRWSVYWKAYRYYKKNLRGWADLVIDEVNTMPFFCKFYVREKNILFVHQLCREIWFYEMAFPLNVLGYALEPIYLWLLRDRKVITVSESTKSDLLRYGFKSGNVSIVSEGIEIEPVADLAAAASASQPPQKYEHPTILAFGSVRAMKRTMHIVKAFEIAKAQVPDLELVLAGSADGRYGANVLAHIKNSRYASSVKCLGRVSKEKKIELMQRSRLIAAASVKEGWGLIVTEAASQGTPAVVYNVDGLRDSVKDGETGIICGANTPENMAENIVKLLENKEEYARLRRAGWEWSKEINFENSYRQFIEKING